MVTFDILLIWKPCFRGQGKWAEGCFVQLQQNLYLSKLKNPKWMHLKKSFWRTTSPLTTTLIRYILQLIKLEYASARILNLSMWLWLPFTYENSISGGFEIFTGWGENNCCFKNNCVPQGWRYCYRNSLLLIHETIIIRPCPCFWNCWQEVLFSLKG